MSYRLLRNLIAIELDPADSKTVSSTIVVVESAVPKPQTGTVVATGPGDYVKGDLVPTPVSVGDRVVVGKGSGQEVVVEGKQLLLITEHDIMVVLNNNNK